MPARLVEVTLINNSDFPIIWQDDGRPHGFWQEPWYPSNIKNLKKGQQGSWRLESGGIATGVEGWALFKVDIPFASNVGSRTEFFRLWWERPYIGHFAKDIQHTLQDPRTNDPPHSGSALTFVKSHGFTDIANIDSSPFEFILAIPGAPFTAPIFLANDANAKHVAWLVEVLNTGTSSALPLQVAAQGIIYAVTNNNDLMWYRHDGRNDGTFRWAFNEGKKVGNGWSVKHIFSGGDGIIYAITDNNDLMWYRHDGRNDGTFRWAFNEGKKVGNGWDVKHIFSGGDGIIYAIMNNNDLMWYRHDGRNDGTFRWAFNEGKKVGNGWERQACVLRRRWHHLRHHEQQRLDVVSPRWAERWHL